MLTSFCSAMIPLPRTEQQFVAGFVVGATAVQVVLKFIAPLLHDADSGQCCRIPKRAESTAKHVPGKLAHQVYVFTAAKSFVETVQHLSQPGRSFAAGNAPAAGFMGVKV